MFKFKKNGPLDLDQTIIPEAYIIHQTAEPRDAVISNDAYAYNRSKPEFRHALEVPKTPKENPSVIIIEL